MRYSEIRQWLLAKVAQRLRRNIDEIDVNLPLEEYGLDSLTIINFTGELESYLKCRLDPEIFWKYRTLDSIAVYLTYITKGEVDNSDGEQALDNLLNMLEKESQTT